MTTEREYREWQKRRNKQKTPTKSKSFFQQTRQKRKNNYGFIWLLFILLSFGFTLKNNAQVFNYFPQNLSLNPLSNFFQSFQNQISSIKSITEEYVTEINEPITPNENVNIINKNKFEQIDQLARNIKYSGNSVDELSKILVKYAVTDEEKARIIYSWITHNISYDVEGLNNFYQNNIYPDIDTITVLESRATICSGYANLYQKLAEKMGLESVIVLGYAKGINYAVGNDNNINHAWNAVKIDDKWFLIDTTWGAGIINNNVFTPEFNPFYFAIPPSEFIYTHFPENSKWQLLNTSISRTEFDNLPDVSPHLFKYNITLVGNHFPRIVTNNRHILIFQAPQNIVAIAQLKSKEKGEIKNHTFVQKQGEKIIVNVTFPETGNYQLDVFAKEKGDNNSYPLIASYEIIAEGKSDKFPNSFQHFTEYNGYLESPLNDNLKGNQNTYFKLKIDSAVDVKVVDSRDKWHDLTRYGNVFAGNVNLNEGKVMVFAKFPQDSRYWALLEYTN